MKRLIWLFLITTAFAQYVSPGFNKGPSGGGGPVIFNNAGTPAIGTTTYSGAFSVTAGGTHLAAFAIVDYIGSSTNTPTITAVTYGGNSMTSCGTPASYLPGTANTYASCWYLANPPTGSNTLAVTCSTGGTDCAHIFVNLVSFKGVNQSTPIRSGTYTSNQLTAASSISLTVTSNTNDLTFSTVIAGSATPSVNSTNQTSDGIDNAGTDGFGSDHATTSSSSVTHTWTLSGSGNPVVIGFSIMGG